MPQGKDQTTIIDDETGLSYYVKPTANKTTDCPMPDDVEANAEPRDHPNKKRRWGRSEVDGMTNMGIIMSDKTPAAHNWSGWPCAWCMNCGQEDRTEIGIADGFGFDDDGNVIPMPPGYLNGPCPEPGSNRCNPYGRSKADG